MDDTSLEDFLSDDDAESSSGDSPPDNDSDRVDPDGVEPAAVTARWDGDGVTCESCGEVVRRCWDAPGGLVCDTCKEWS